MRILKDRVISTLIGCAFVLAALAAADFASQAEVTSEEDALAVINAKGAHIDAELLKESLTRFQSLSEDRKAAIRQKMLAMSQERQRNIKAIEQKISDYRLQKSKQQRLASQDLQQIRRLQVLRQFALHEDAPETAERVARLISLYENRELKRPSEESSVKVE